MGKREDEGMLLEALAAVEAALARGAEDPASVVALPRVLPSSVARQLEDALRARGFVGARYSDEPRSWDLWDRLETVLGLDRDEPRVEWERNRDENSGGKH